MVNVKWNQRSQWQLSANKLWLNIIHHEPMRSKWEQEPRPDMQLEEDEADTLY
jgi:hypothetical protein